jgi:hypothetical protein
MIPRQYGPAFVPMKSILILIAAAAAFASLLVLAQSDPTAATPTPSPAIPGGNAGEAASGVPLPGQTGGPALEKNLPLIPEYVPGGAENGGSGKKRKSGGAHAGASPEASPTNTFDVEQDIRMKIAVRKAVTEAFNEPAIHEEWVAANRTHTDPARRTAFEHYFNHLFDRVVEIDPSIALLANYRRAAAISRMQYPRLGEVDPQDDPFATPAPASEGPNPPAQDEAPYP